MKSKAKYPITTYGWMHRRWYAVLLGVVFLFNGLLYVHEVPVNNQGIPSRFVHSVYEQTIGRVLGVQLQITIQVINMTILPPNDIYIILSPLSKVAYGCVMVLAAIVVVLWIMWLQRFRRFFRWWVYGMYAAYIPLYLWAASLPYNFMSPPLKFLEIRLDHTIRCTAIITPEIQLQGTFVQEDHAYNAEPNKITMTRDGWKTSRLIMIMFFERNYEVNSSCREQGIWTNIGAFDDQLFWYLNGTSVLTHDDERPFRFISTRDGGETWSIWHLGDAVYHFGDAGCSIQEVRFTDHLRGEMQVPCRSRDIVLYTADGGIHWQYPDPRQTPQN